MSDDDWTVVGFIWPTGFDAIAAKAQAGDDRAQRCLTGVRAILVETVDGVCSCADCGLGIPDASQLGACATAQRGNVDHTRISQVGARGAAGWALHDLHAAGWRITKIDDPPDPPPLAA